MNSPFNTRDAVSVIIIVLLFSFAVIGGAVYQGDSSPTQNSKQLPATDLSPFTLNNDKVSETRIAYGNEYSDSTSIKYVVENGVENGSITDHRINTVSEESTVIENDVVVIAPIQSNVSEGSLSARKFQFTAEQRQTTIATPQAALELPRELNETV